MISIVIPVYNQANKLSRCLDSILAQSFKDYEIIIVNDGSTDNFKEVIKNYNFKIINQENEGANSARNRGAKEAQGEYLLFCDADIEMKPNMLEIMLKELESHPSAGYAYSSFKYGLKTFKLAPFSAEKLKEGPCIHTTSLIRAKHFPGFSAKGGSAFGWDESIKRLQDWDLWLTILELGYQGVWIDEVLFKVKAGGTISAWLPSFAYKLFPFLSGVKKYKEAVKIIKNKHGLV